MLVLSLAEKCYISSRIILTLRGKSAMKQTRNLKSYKERQSSPYKRLFRNFSREFQKLPIMLWNSHELCEELDQHWDILKTSFMMVIIVYLQAFLKAVQEWLFSQTSLPLTCRICCELCPTGFMGVGWGGEIECFLKQNRTSQAVSSNITCLNRENNTNNALNCEEKQFWKHYQ